MNAFVESWKTAWSRQAFRVRLGITFPFLAVMLAVLATFLQWVERRAGVVIADPILNLFPPSDLTWFIFGLIYGALITAIVFLFQEPDRLLLACQSYSLMAVFRIIAMYLVPLDPPSMTIPLEDPFVQLFGGGNVLMKDLFFSGHTSTLFLLYLTASRGTLKIAFLLCTIAVAILIVIHHSHYAVDVYVAPFVAYTAYRIAYLLNRRFDPAVRYD